MDVRLEDGTVIKNVPPGTTKSQLMARLNKSGTGAAPTNDRASLAETIRRSNETGTIDSFVRGFAQGATANFADEISAGMDAITQPLLGRGSSAGTISQRYEENLSGERVQDRANASAHPVADISGNVTGAIMGPGKFLNRNPTTMGMVKQGATTGSIYGFGAGEGGFQNRATSGVIDGGAGAFTGGIFGMGVNAFNKVRPGNVAANYVNRQYANSRVDPATGRTFAQESDRIGTEIGQTYTPGQATGSRSLLTIEGLIRRHPASADKMQAFDERQLDVSLRNLNANLDRLAANPAGPEATGNLVSKAFDKVFTNLTNTRRQTAAADFGKVDELAGRYRVIKSENLKAEIDKIAADFDVPGGGDASAALVNRIRGIATDIDRAGPQGLSAKETQRLLEVYGNAQRGTGKIFGDLDTAQQRMIAGRLKDAVLRDIDTAADQGGHVGQIAEALKTARNNYKANSQAINELEKSVVGRLFGSDYDKAPERIAQAVRNMKPSELKQSMDILSKADPATSQTVKRFLVEDAMNAAGVGNASGAPQAQIAGDVMFSPAKFLTAIRKSPVWGAFDDVERKNMETAVRDLERIAFRAGTDGSPTAPLNMALGILSKPAGQTLAGGALGGGAAMLTGGDAKEGAFAGAAAGGFGGMAIPRLAKAITTPQGQRNLRTLRTAKSNSSAARAATAALVTLLAPSDAPDETGGGK